VSRSGLEPNVFQRDLTYSYAWSLRIASITSSGVHKCKYWSGDGAVARGSL
jgi:hypothetical protein